MRPESEINSKARKVAQKFDDILYDSYDEHKNLSPDKRREMSGKIFSAFLNQVKGENIDNLIEGLNSIK